ncbi:phage head completion protein [Budvicia aquatica]|uniref:Bacteriophage head-tail adaptor n=1 Tax=Budvicia aquatica TaxID=82979 RepID=A0A484ZV37_9GAMM|nr:Bacteriophage head-tail adaptor [Budvicia aquatica]
MRAGDLKDRVMLQKPVTSRAASGQQVITFEDVKPVWAKVRTHFKQKNQRRGPGSDCRYLSYNFTTA